MRILFFDTETTGLPKDWKAPIKQVDNWPRVFYLAWVLTDEKGTVLRQQRYVVTPDGWTIPEKEFWIDKGYTTNWCYINGIRIETVLNIFLADYKQANFLVSHNMAFDYSVLGAEIIRSGFVVDKAAAKPAQICTKEASTEFCKLPFLAKAKWATAQRYKWPTLDELHYKLFADHAIETHDALGDVLTLKKCFFELIRQGVIALEVIKPVA